MAEPWSPYKALNALIQLQQLSAQGQNSLADDRGGLLEAQAAKANAEAEAQRRLQSARTAAGTGFTPEQGFVPGNLGQLAMEAPGEVPALLEFNEEIRAQRFDDAAAPGLEAAMRGQEYPGGWETYWSNLAQIDPSRAVSTFADILGKQQEALKREKEALKMDVAALRVVGETLKTATKDNWPNKVAEARHLYYSLPGAPPEGKGYNFDDLMARGYTAQTDILTEIGTAAQRYSDYLDSLQDNIEGNLQQRLEAVDMLRQQGVLTPEKARQYKIDFVEADLEGARKGTGTTVYMPGADKANEALGREIPAQLRTRADELKNAPTLLNSMEKALTLIDQSMVGAGSGVGLTVSKFAQTLGVDLGIDPDRVTNTDALQSLLNIRIAGLLKKTLGAQFTATDREFLEKALGNLEKDPGALKQILKMYQEDVRSEVANHNARVEDFGRTIGNREMVKQLMATTTWEERPSAATPKGADGGFPLERIPGDAKEGEMFEDEEGHRYIIQGGKPVQVKGVR